MIAATNPHHVEPDLLLRRVLAAHLVHNLPLVHHANAIREGHDLVEIGRNQEHRLPLELRLHDLSVDKLGRTDVDSPGRLACEQQRRIRTHFPRNDHLLLVPAGERVSRRHLVGSPDIVLGNCRSGELPYSL